MKVKKPNPRPVSVKSSTTAARYAMIRQPVSATSTTNEVAHTASSTAESAERPARSTPTEMMPLAITSAK
jgi:hypothetical protein